MSSILKRISPVKKLKNKLITNQSKMYFSLNDQSNTREQLVPTRDMYSESISNQINEFSNTSLKNQD